jgi:signal transduction histidine kinase/CheY-like chemotaxis protein
MPAPRLFRARWLILVGIGAGVLLSAVFATATVVMIRNAQQTQLAIAQLEQVDMATVLLSQWRQQFSAVAAIRDDILHGEGLALLPSLDQKITDSKAAFDAFSAAARSNPSLTSVAQEFEPTLTKWLEDMQAVSASLHMLHDPRAVDAYLTQVRANDTLNIADVAVANIAAIRSLRRGSNMNVKAELQQWESRAVWWLLVGANVMLLTIMITAGVIALAVYDRRRAAAELVEASDRLTAAELSRTRLLAAASHDLRQPLQAMTLFTTALRRRVADAYVSSLIEGVSSAVSSLERMFNGLLDISKLDAGIVAADRTDFAVARLLHNLEVEFAALAEAKGLDFKVISDGAVVHTDPVLLESMVRNIVANAIKYTRHGHVVVSCRKADTRSVLIEVSDTGAGISETEYENIFREFHRIGASGGSEEGLGLGLAIVLRLSKLLGVTIDVQSILGVGSTFALHVPISAYRVAQPALPAGRPQQTAPARIRVLLVDDDPLLRLAISAALIDHGMEVTAFGSAADAMALFEDSAKRGSFDVALIDYNLGAGSTGVDLLDRLAVRFSLALPALIMTGEQDPEILEELGDSGYAWLQKPVETALLVSALTGLVTEAGNDEGAADLLSALQRSTLDNGVMPHISVENGKAVIVS